MKKLQRLLAVCVCFALLALSLPCGVLAKANGWTASKETSSEIAIDGDDISIICNPDGTSAAASAEAENVLSKREENESASLINFSFMLSGTQTRIVKGMSLTDGSNSVSLMSITGTSARALGKSTETVSLETEREYEAEIALDISDGKAVFRLNGQDIAEESISNLKDLDANSLKIKVSVDYMRASSASCTFVVKNFSEKSGKPFDFKGFKIADTILSENAIYTLSEINSGIAVLYDGFASSKLLKAENYSLKNEGNEVEITLDTTGASPIIMPRAEQMGEYTLSVNEIEDCFSQSVGNAEITFKAVPDGYERPQIKAEYAKSEIKLGETLDIFYEISGDSWDKAELYINGINSGIYQSGSFKYAFSPKTAGEYEIGLKITDSYGGTVTKNFTVKVEENDAPKIEIPNAYGGTVTFEAGTAEKIILINAADDDGIERVTAEANGFEITLTQAPYELDISRLNLGMGVHEITVTAYDIYGLSSMVSVTAAIEKTLTENVFSDGDFIEAADGSIESGIAITRQRGYAKITEADSTHGRVLQMGMDENCDTSYSGSQYTYANIAIPSAAAKNMGIEFEVCVLNKPSSNLGCAMGIRRSDASMATMLSVNAAEFASGSKSFAFEQNKWYSVKIAADIENGRYSLYIDGTPVCVNEAIDFGTSVTHMRFWTTTSLSNFCDIAFDNISMYKIIESPSVSSIGYDEILSSESIPAAAERINVVLSSAVENSDINAETVSLSADGKTVALNNVRYNNVKKCIELYPQKALLPGTRYTVKVDKNVHLLGSETIGEDIYAYFTVCGDFPNVSDVKFSTGREMTDITFTASRTEEQPEKLFGIITVLDSDGKFKYTMAKEFTIGTSQGEFTVSVPAQPADTIRFSVTDNLTDGNIIEHIVSGK